jgi:hypothetical protein
MGTNYYVRENHCKCCNRYDATYHIGKSSWGWAFGFRGYRAEVAPQPLTSWAEWKTFLVDKVIVDEYGETIDYREFCMMIENEKSPRYYNEVTGRFNLIHNAEGKKGPLPYFNSLYDWDDIEGYSFTTREFS